MTEIPASKISMVSFADYEIINLLLKEDSFSCTLGGCYIKGEGSVDSDVTLRIDDWTSLQITRYDESGENPRTVTVAEAGQIREICESRLSEESAVISGFNVSTGHWQTFEFLCPTLSITVIE
ncbi:hypothetical protein [Bremerella alba]|uniref:Uncharacterized protein n=1 Tax=Bremerella alba TaxID=980252 RepID=A0A7V9A8L7_9BACT|nr:hypothetical protein [Bremerella alba]MBA2116630.1 hypothetical protein [Bremerella alba]